METSLSSAAARPKIGRPKDSRKSRITNNVDILANCDQRSATARRYRDLVTAILADQAGVDECSEARKQLIRRFAAAAVLAEQMESRLANGEEISIERHALLCSTLTRLAQRIGIDRRQRDVTPSLAEYLAQQQAAE